MRADQHRLARVLIEGIRAKGECDFVRIYPSTIFLGIMGSFGAGPHRCLGSHLARQELAILLEEWHRLIPDYELVEQPVEHAGGVWGLDALRLRWPV